MTLVPSGAVLEALRKDDAPGVKVATLARREEAEEMIGLWVQHLSNESGKELKVVVLDNGEWKPSQGDFKLTWVSVLCNARVEIGKVGVVGLGMKGSDVSTVAVQKVQGVPTRQEGSTVRITVYAKYLGDRLTSSTAGALRRAWPNARGVNFGGWRPEKGSKGMQGHARACKGEVEAYMLVAKVVDQLVRQSGRHGVFVSRLASDLAAKPKKAVRWVDRLVDNAADERAYLEVVLASAGEAPVVHRRGGGRDLGAEDACESGKQSPPYVWRASAPRWWTDEQLEAVLFGNGWKSAEVVAQLGHGTWRFKAAERLTRPRATSTSSRAGS